MSTIEIKTRSQGSISVRTKSQGIVGIETTAQHTFVVEQSGAVPWTPAEISPYFWWRADTVIMSGSNLVTATDLSGNGRDGTATGTITLGATINSEPTFNYDGAGGYIAGAFAANSLRDVSAVVKTADTSSLLMSDKGPSNYFGLWTSGSASAPQSVGVATPTYYDDSALISPTTRAALYTAWGTGVATIAGFRGVPSGFGVAVGAFYYPSAGFYYTGTFPEMLGFSAALSASDYAKLEGYLAWRYGITLPSGHAYELAAPTL
jgi:hypothetical protein